MDVPTERQKPHVAHLRIYFMMKVSTSREKNNTSKSCAFNCDLPSLPKSDLLAILFTNGPKNLVNEYRKNRLFRLPAEPRKRVLHSCC